ncbi:MAG: hypothetical protein DRN12_02690 [Thermoplasmata archaeon]|mgnify:CR=1 FL=1|nr:MAG: hypothetical protein DRN12_02690 [Thermoplasmata archaeon]
MSDNAVVALPMRLIVSIVIGTAVLSAILSFISDSSYITPSMVVSVDPIFYKMNSSRGILNISLSVSSKDGKPIKDAVVIIQGLDGFASAITDSNGNANISISIVFPKYIHEGYLDVTVKALDYPNFHQDDMIRVIQV